MTEDDLLNEAATGLITTAVEGGINYWATVESYRWDCPVADRHATVVEGDHPAEAGPHTVTVASMRAAMVKVADGDVREFHNSGYRDSYRLRLRRMLANAAMGVEDDNYDYDAGDADSMFQIAIFGEVIYG
jgi:hypothetical protein